MISFTSRQKYYFYSGPMDMRKDIDTLSEVVRSQMGLDSYIEESVFIFLPVFDEHRSCYKICWSDFVTLTEGVQVTKMQIKEDVV